MRMQNLRNYSEHGHKFSEMLCRKFYLLPFDECVLACVHFTKNIAHAKGSFCVGVYFDIASGHHTRT